MGQAMLKKSYSIRHFNLIAICLHSKSALTDFMLSIVSVFRGMKSDVTKQNSAEMMRKRRLYKQVALVALCLFCFRQVWFFSSYISSGIFTTTDIQPSAYSLEFLDELNETAQLYPKLFTTVERIGPGIDPRTSELRNKTLYALAGVSSYSCNLREGILDKFFTPENDHVRVLRYKYMQEMQIVHTVVEMSQPSGFTRSSQGNKISLLTQLSSDRIYMLDILVQSWDGPIVAVIYAGHNLLPKQKQLSYWLNGITRDDVVLLLVKRAGMLYPVNWLRNLAIRRAESKYIFVIDGDFIPSENLHKNALNHLNTLERQRIKKTVLIVPAFEMLHPMVESNIHVPKGRDDLIAGVKLGLVDGFHRGEFEAAHNLTNYRKWYKTKVPYLLPKLPACDEHFEPYIVMERAASPYYPETLLERRKNKIAYQYDLCIHGYQYMIVNDGFLIHKHHSTSMRAQNRVEYCVEIAWRTFMSYAKTHDIIPVGT